MAKRFTAKERASYRAGFKAGRAYQIKIRNMNWRRDSR